MKVRIRNKKIFLNEISKLNLTLMRQKRFYILYHNLRKINRIPKDIKNVKKGKKIGYVISFHLISLFL